MLPFFYIIGTVLGTIPTGAGCVKVGTFYLQYRYMKIVSFLQRDADEESTVSESLLAREKQATLARAGAQPRGPHLAHTVLSRVDISQVSELEPGLRQRIDNAILAVDKDTSGRDRLDAVGAAEGHSLDVNGPGLNDLGRDAVSHSHGAEGRGRDDHGHGRGAEDRAADGYGRGAEGRGRDDHGRGAEDPGADGNGRGAEGRGRDADGHGRGAEGRGRDADGHGRGADGRGRDADNSAMAGPSGRQSQPRRSQVPTGDKNGTPLIYSEVGWYGTSRYLPYLAFENSIEIQKLDEYPS